MQIVRFAHKDRVIYGALQSDMVRPLRSDPFADNTEPGQETIPLKAVKLLAPVLPSKVICVGLNYKDHARELGMPIPREPIIFLKPPTAVIGPDDHIIYPQQVTRLDYEAELAVVIRKKAKDISAGQAGEYILGYTCLNDITARDIQKRDRQWTRAKSFDTFCPIGPSIATGIDTKDIKIKLFVNGLEKQSSSTSDLIFGIDTLVSFISKVMTLLPGDIIATGTPPDVGPLSRGDVVEVDIEDIGRLRNTVV